MIENVLNVKKFLNFQVIIKDTYNHNQDAK